MAFYSQEIERAHDWLNALVVHSDNCMYLSMAAEKNKRIKEGHRMTAQKSKHIKALESNCNDLSRRSDLYLGGSYGQHCSG